VKNAYKGSNLSEKNHELKKAEDPTNQFQRGVNIRGKFKPH